MGGETTIAQGLRITDDSAGYPDHNNRRQDHDGTNY